MHAPLPLSPRCARPVRVGTRARPSRWCRPAASSSCSLRHAPARAFEEHVITTTGDATQRAGRLAEVGGKGLWAKEIHEALAGWPHRLRGAQPEGPGDHPAAGHRAGLHAPARGRPRRADPRPLLHPPDPDPPFSGLPAGTVVGSSSVRRQAQLLHVRPDLARIVPRGNVPTRLDKVAAGVCGATLLAYGRPDPPWPRRARRGGAGPGAMLPAAGQGIVASPSGRPTSRFSPRRPPSRTPRHQRSHGRTRPAGAARRFLPHPDRRLCALLRRMAICT